MNALDLLNAVVRESGIDLDSLSSSDWASPPEKMHQRIKEWVGQAWLEIQVERAEWEFMSRKGSFTIYPRVYVELGNRATAPAAGAEYETDTTEATFTVLSTTLLSGAWASGTAKAYIDYEDLDGTFKFDEFADETTPVVAGNIFKIRDWGAWDLSTIITDLSEANTLNFTVQSTGSDTTQDNTEAFDQNKLVFVPWETWVDNYEGPDAGTGMPQYFTIRPNGHYSFYPRPDEGYFVKFTYTAEPGTFTAYGDTPDLADHLQPIIVWKALLYYAQYDRAGDVERRARERYRFYKRIMDRDKKPRFTWPRSRYTRG